MALAAALLLLAASPSHAEDLTLDCVIDPSQKVNLGSPVTGILAEVTVKRGDFVHTGDVVARLESSVEAASVALGRAQAAATEEIDAQKTRLTVAESKLARARTLAKNGNVSTEAVEQANADASIAERDLARLIQQKHLAELELARAEAQLGQHTLKSPIDGLVSLRRLSPGEFITQDSYVVTIVALDPLYVETFVPVTAWGAVKAGSPATVELADPIGGKYPATVTVVDRLFDTASGTFGARLELKNPGNTLPAGQRCRVTFNLPALPGAKAAGTQ